MIDCERCEGTGCIDCPECDRDNPDSDCPECDGAGYTDCPRCEGCGQVEGEATKMTEIKAQLGDGEWRLTTDHAASSYGIPVLVGPDGTAYGRADAITRQPSDDETWNMLIEGADDQAGWMVAREVARAAWEQRTGLRNEQVSFTEYEASPEWAAVALYEGPKAS